MNCPKRRAKTSDVKSAHDQRETHGKVRAKFLRSCIPAIGKVALNKLHLDADRARRRGPNHMDTVIIGTARVKRTWFSPAAK